MIDEAALAAPPDGERSDGTDAPGLYPIRTVADLTGVNAVTLRAWETRHGFLRPVRKASGHRLYTQQDVDLIHRVVGLLDRGMRIGDVKAALEAGLDPVQQDGLDAGGAWRRYREGMLAAVIRFNERDLDEIYGDALALYPIRIVTQKLINPLLVELGRRWESGQGSVAEEHFFGFFLRNKLGARFHHRARNPDGVRVLMACLAGERHEIGLLLFALAANEAGFCPVVLGADMPLEDLPDAAAKTDCAAIVLSGFVMPESVLFRGRLPAVVARSSVPILVGGQLSVAAFDELRRAGVEPLGTDIDTGLRRLGEVAAAGASA